MFAVNVDHKIATSAAAQSTNYILFHHVYNCSFQLSSLVWIMICSVSVIPLQYRTILFAAHVKLGRRDGWTAWPQVLPAVQKL